MRSCRLTFTLAIAAIGLSAVAADPLKHRAGGDAAIAARKVLIEHCGACHGDPDPKKRQGRLWVNDWSSLVGNAGPIPFVSLDKDDLRSQVLEFMKDGSMPPGGRKRPAKEEIEAVETWIKLGANENPYPTKFDDAAVLKVITEDLAQVGTEKGKDYRQNVRYVSLAHLVEKGTDLAKAEAELVTALVGRSHGGKIRLSKPKLEQLQKGDKSPANTANVANKAADPAVDLFGKILKPVLGSAGTVYRLDLNELGWDGGNKLLFEWTKFGDPEGEFNMKPFDLIHLEYPYSHTTTDAALKKGADAVVADMNPHRNKPGGKEPLAQLRAVPFVRGDWLAKALWHDGKPTPLADDLDSLTDLATELAQSTNDRVGTGPDFVPFVGGEKLPDATAPSVWAWYQAGVAPKDPPFKFTFATEGDKPLKENGSFKLTADCDQDVVVSLVEVQADYVRVHRFGNAKLEDEKRPTLDIPANKNTIIAPNEKGRLIPYSTAANQGKPLYYLLFVSPKNAPHGEPVVVRSKHEKSKPAVWRVLPNADDVIADRGPTVRAVVRIEVEVKKKMD